MAQQDYNEKYIQMTQTPVEQLILRLAGPSVVTMLITSFYNMADTFFISQISTAASGAVGVAFPVMALIQALGFFFGQGSGAGLSQALGSRDEARARELSNVGFFSTLLCASLLALLAYFVLEPLIFLLGATDTIYPHCAAYLRLILLGAPLMAGSFVLNNLLRYQGNSYLGMVGIGIGAVLNILLDPILIFGLELGITGAALATVASQAVGFGLLIFLCNTRSGIPISLRFFHPTVLHYQTITRSGVPALLRQSVASISVMVLNVCAHPFGDAVIAAMAIVGKIAHFSSSVMLGFGQGFQPVCGYNYGAKLYDRVKRGYFFCVRSSFLVLAGFSMVEFFFAHEIIGVFRRGDAQVIAIGARALRLQCLTLVCSSVIIPSNMMLQVTGRMVPASLIGAARQGLFLIPLLFLLTEWLGITGLQMAQPLADICALLLTLPLVLPFLSRLDDPFERMPGAKTKH